MPNSLVSNVETIWDRKVVESDQQHTMTRDKMVRSNNDFLCPQEEKLGEVH